MNSFFKSRSAPSSRHATENWHVTRHANTSYANFSFSVQWKEVEPNYLNTGTM